MSEVGGFDPQPCASDDVPVPLDVTIVAPLPVPVDVVSPNPLPVTGTVSVEEPVDVNVLGTVSVAEPVTVDGSVSVTGTVAVTPNPLPVTGTVTANVSPNPLPVTGTVTVTPNPLPVTGTISTGGSTAASTTLSAATTGNGLTIDFTSARSNVSLFILVNGTVTAGVVDMQGSQDGVNWVKIASSGSLSTGLNQRVDLTGGAFRWYRGIVSDTIVGGGSVTATLMFA